MKKIKEISIVASIAITSTIIVCILAYILKFTNFGNTNNFDYLLIYNLQTKKTRSQDIEKTLQPYLKTKETINIQSDKKGESLEISANVSLKKGTDIDSLVKTLQKINGVEEISITPIQNGAEF